MIGSAAGKTKVTKKPRWITGLRIMDDSMRLFLFDTAMTCASALSRFRVRSSAVRTLDQSHRRGDLTLDPLMT
jgi:hypothetical protein